MNPPLPKTIVSGSNVRRLFQAGLNLAFVGLAIGVLAQAGRAAAGDLDTTYGNNGTAFTSLSGGTDAVTALALQNDGKVVAAGNSNTNAALARYETNGSLDLSFGNQGTAVISDEDFTLTTKAVAVRPDGRILIAGSLGDNFQSKFSLIGLNADGSLDESFGDLGRVEVAFGGANQRATTMILQPDGRVLVAGYAEQGPNKLLRFAAARLNADGSLDDGFGSGGKVTLAVTSGNNRANALALQKDGKIVLAGNGNAGGAPLVAVARLNFNGTPDGSFGNGGKIAFPFRNHDNAIEAAVIQGNGKILLGGAAKNNAGQFHFAAARLLPNGELDASFGSSGLQLGISSGANAHAMAYLKDGTIVFGGGLGSGTDEAFCVERWNRDGSMDTGFSGDGAATAPMDPLGGRIQGLVVQSDGKIVGGGFKNTGFNESEFAMARFDGGAVDETPSITGFNPIAARIADPVTVFGYNFTGATGVTVGSTLKPQSFTVLDANRIQIPALAAGTESGRVRVTTLEGTAVSADIFHVLPKILSFSPGSGPAGTLVTVTGTGFRLSSGSNVTAVRFSAPGGGFISGTDLNVISKTQLRVRVPSGAISGPLRIRNDYGATQSADSFNVSAGAVPSGPSGRTSKAPAPAGTRLAMAY